MSGIRRGRKGQKTTQKLDAAPSNQKKVKQSNKQAVVEEKKLSSRQVSLPKIVGQHEFVNGGWVIVINNLVNLCNNSNLDPDHRAELEQKLAEVIKSATEVIKKNFDAIILSFSGIEAYIIAQSSENLRDNTFLTAKIETQISELTFINMEGLKPYHLEYIADCCEEKKSKLELKIIECKGVKCSDIGVFDDVNVDVEIKKN